MIIEFSQIIGLILGGQLWLGFAVGGVLPVLVAITYGVLARLNRFQLSRSKLVGAGFASIGLCLVSLPQNGCLYTLTFPLLASLCVVAYGCLTVSCVIGFRAEIPGDERAHPGFVVGFAGVPILVFLFSLVSCGFSVDSLFS